MSSGGAPTPLAHRCSNTHVHCFLALSADQSMKLKHKGRWGWGIYGLNGWGIYGLNGWSIYDLNGCGIYDLNGWGHLWLKWMGRLVTVFGRYAQNIIYKKVSGGRMSPETLAYAQDHCSTPNNICLLYTSPSPRD